MNKKNELIIKSAKEGAFLEGYVLANKLNIVHLGDEDFEEIKLVSTGLSEAEDNDDCYLFLNVYVGENKYAPTLFVRSYENVEFEDDKKKDKIILEVIGENGAVYADSTSMVLHFNKDSKTMSLALMRDEDLSSYTFHEFFNENETKKLISYFEYIKKELSND